MLCVCVYYIRCVRELVGAYRLRACTCLRAEHDAFIITEPPLLVSMSRLPKVATGGEIRKNAKGFRELIELRGTLRHQYLYSST